MNILQINNTDLPGARFNGYNTMQYLRKNSIDCKQIVMEKYSFDSDVIQISIPQTVHKYMQTFEKENSIKSLIFPYGKLISQYDAFKEADIVHYHLIHNDIMSIYDLPNLFNLKKSIWTIHDPWIFTGHCIHPIECEKWKSGCGKCQFLSRHFQMQNDNTAFMWKKKKELFDAIDNKIDLIVASEWMYDLIRTSPITKNVKNVHVIPFGINLELYKSDDNIKTTLRKKHKINKNDIVIFFRSDKSEYKGLSYIFDALKKLPYDEYSITLVTVGEIGELKQFQNKYNILEYGWINDETKLAELYKLSDIFLMPSIAEAFGVMAIEAMSSSLAVVVLNGTALPSVVQSPHGGISTDKESFASVIRNLITDKELRIKKGIEARKIAETCYDEKQHFDRLLELYLKVYER